MLHHPPAHVPLVDRFSFFRVLHEVGNAGKYQRQFRIVNVLLTLEVDLEVFPFDGMQFFVKPDDAGIAVRGLLLAKKKWPLVCAVDDPITRWFGTGESQQRGEYIGDVNHLIALGSRLDAAGPADQKRRANAAFRRAEIRAVKKTSRPPAGQVILGAVVAAIDNDGIVGPSTLLDLRAPHPHTTLDHPQPITPIPS